MDLKRILFLREILVTDGNGKPAIVIEFSYDNPRDREPRFFGVPANQLLGARQLYSEWGGERPESYRRGTTVRNPNRPS